MNLTFASADRFDQKDKKTTQKKRFVFKFN